ncbi:caspase family protein [Streptomyces sp. NPDC053792]|uniref:caspase family protein n=1 Tax=Streptomyces sp. NPDC053792 TaxID=3365716 RepID=UPI0037CFC27A
MSLPDPDGTRVVLIGASEYQRFPDLPAVRNNLSRLAELFRSPRFGGLPAGHCATVLDPADAKAMLDAVHQAASEATDTLVVYFAGHGIRSPVATAVPRWRSTWAPRRSSRTRPPSRAVEDHNAAGRHAVQHFGAEVVEGHGSVQLPALLRVPEREMQRAVQPLTMAFPGRPTLST